MSAPALSQPDSQSWPSFDWCSSNPIALGVPDPGALFPPIPELLDATDSDSQLPAVVDPASDREQLIAVETRRIRVIGAYWHTGWSFARPGAYLREGVLHRLATAAANLPDGFGLAVWDAWRDPRLQVRLHEVAYADASLPAGFVSEPSTDPTRPAPHSTGGTVDLTLTWSNVPLALGTQFDAFVPAAHARALESISDDDQAAVLARNLRRMLRSTMLGAGFVQLNCEWWHFEYGTRLWGAVRARAPRYGGHLGPQRG